MTPKASSKSLGPSDAAEPDEAQAYYLAEQHRQAGRLADAVAGYRDLLTRAPRHLAALEALESLLVEQGSKDEAAEIHNRRTRVEARNAHAIGKALTMEGQHERAAPFFERAIALKPDYEKAHWRLGETFSHLNRKPEALRCYRRCQELDPDDVEAGFMIAALGEGEMPPRPPAAYVQNYFDVYAEIFDEHLCKSLNYRGPEILFEYVRRVVDRNSGLLDILDIGCETGLAGIPFRELANTLSGVDLSQEMISRAKARGLYDALHVEDALTFLERAPEPAYDLLIACDSLVYFGDLEALMTAAFQALRAGGLFALSLEKGKDEEFTLQPSDRYAHHPDYLPALAKGRFHLREAGRETVRLEFGKPAVELIYVLEKALN